MINDKNNITSKSKYKIILFLLVWRKIEILYMIKCRVQYYSKTLTYSKMAQFIRTPTTFDEAYDIGIQQVSQIIYHLERAIEVCWQDSSNRVLVQDNGEYFYLHSPDILSMTLKQVIEGLGYGEDQLVVVWAIDDSEDEVLSLPVQNVPLNQLALYAAGVDIPNEPPQGNFPMTVGTSNTLALPIYAPNQPHTITLTYITE
jgi:hypothetical protein